MTSEYWQKILSAQIPRRRLLRDARLAGTALGAVALANACGGGQGEAPTITPEAAEKGEAIFNLGNLQVEINGWEEPEPRGISKINEVVYKPVEIETTVRNISSEPVDIGVLNRDKEDHIFDFDLYKESGDVFSGIGAEFNQDLIATNVLNKPYYEFFLPPGFAIPMTIKDEVPEDVGEYQLGVESYSLDMPSPDNFIAKGQTVASRGLIDPSVQVNEYPQAVDFGVPELGAPYQSRFGQVTINGIITKRSGYTTAQDVRVSIFNHGSEELILPVRIVTMLVYLKDGRVVLGYPYDGYTIEPNKTQVFDINIGYDNGSPPSELNVVETFNFSDSVVLLMIWNKWAAWRISASDWQSMKA